MIPKPPMKPAVKPDTQPASKQDKVKLEPCSAEEMALAAQQRLLLAIKAVESVLGDPDAKDSDKIAAATFIRDTSYPKSERKESRPDQLIRDLWWHEIGQYKAKKVGQSTSLPIIDNASAMTPNEEIDV